MSHRQQLMSLITYALAAGALLAGALLTDSVAFAQSASAVPTGQLPRTVEPTSIALELKIDPARDRFEGRTRIHGTVTAATDTLWLHGRDLAIERATIATRGGEALPLKAELADVSGVLKLTAPMTIPAGEATIEIIYSAPFGQLQGAYKVRDHGTDYVVTQMEPLGARNAFPGFDEPSFKQPWEISLVVPQDMNAVANTAQVNEEPLAGGLKRLTFARTENLPSYLIAFAVGPWDIVEWQDIPPNAVRKTPLRLRGIAAKGRGEQMRYALEHTGAIVAAQEAYFGIAYPFDKLDLLAAPDFWAGAMENAGLIVYRDSLMFANDDSPTRLKQGYWGTHSHELAHQWFGDLVTMPWWDDLWLNEGFATWFGNKIVGELRPDFNVQRSRLEGALAAMDQDALASTRRIHEPVDDFTDIQSAFDGITYQKGGATLAMFESYLGPVRFRDAIRAYLQQHARGNATAADLVGAVAAHSDHPAAVAAAFNSFIDQPGVPYVHTDLVCRDGRASLKVRQQRYLPLGSTADAGQHWGLPLCVRYPSGDGTKKQCELVTQPEATIALDAPGCPAWLMPNADGAGYYRYAVAADDQAALDAAFDRLNENEQRLYADSLAAAFHAGSIDAGTYLAAMPKLALASTRQTVTAAMGEIQWMVEHLAADATEQARLRTFGADIYRPQLQRLGLASRPGDSDDDRLLRASLLEFMAWVARDDATRTRLAALGRTALGIGDAGDAGDGKLMVDATSPDQRPLALALAANTGDAATFAVIDKHLRGSQDPVLRRELLAALGSFDDPALAAKARALALEPQLLRRNELVTVADTQMQRPALRADARVWLERNFDTLLARLSPSGARLAGLYAAGMCSDAAAAALDARFDQRVRDVEGGPRALAQSVESVRLCGTLHDAQAARGFGRGLH